MDKIIKNIFNHTLQLTTQHLYAPCGFITSHVTINAESAEYGAGTYWVHGSKIICRTAKITPKKVGQFVAIWQRDADGITQPQHIDDDFDFLVINCIDKQNQGQFVFPKTVLAKQGIISTSTKRGKNGIRVYPIWDLATNKQAIRTQRWQLDFFLMIDDNADLNLTKQLYLSA